MSGGTPVDSKPNPLLRNPMLGKAAAGLAIYEGLSQAWSKGRGLYNDRVAFTVVVGDRDPIYADVHQWLLQILPDTQHRALSVGTRRGGDFDTSTPMTSGEGGKPKRTPLEVSFDDKRARVVVVDGHRVRVQVDRPEVPADSPRRPDETIKFTARSYAGQQAVLAHLHHLHAQRSEERVPNLKMIDQWGSWRTRNDLPPRPIDSVVLPHDQKNAIVEDLTAFLAAEQRYAELAIPWHRGYLFHGPPGTGKTSLVRALASTFKMDLWYISLSDLKKEASLMALLADVGPRSLLLLEDIDTLKISKSRETKEGEISMSSLLNALDGAATPHGLITMMTTNHFDQLDDALVRAGRMDRIEEIGFPTPTLVAELYERFYGVEFPTAMLPEVDRLAVSTAALSEALKRHLDDPIEGLSELASLWAKTPIR